MAATAICGGVKFIVWYIAQKRRGLKEKFLAAAARRAARCEYVRDCVIDASSASVAAELWFIGDTGQWDASYALLFLG